MMAADLVELVTRAIDPISEVLAGGAGCRSSIAEEGRNHSGERCDTTGGKLRGRETRNCRHEATSIPDAIPRSAG